MSVWVEIEKRQSANRVFVVTLHVSVWVEMMKSRLYMAETQSRSTWACELKCPVEDVTYLSFCHAPRERVSWNLFLPLLLILHKVTLHVSVWVEIIDKNHSSDFVNRHAPRERVSWNFNIRQLELYLQCHAPRERVSWNFNIILTIFSHISSRSTWACELKLIYQALLSASSRHAPRERVSWNLTLRRQTKEKMVTLHVSVWVEMKIFTILTAPEMVTLHVSVWVEIFLRFPFFAIKYVTLHVSVWVEITFCNS